MVNPTHQISIDSTACDSIQWDGNWLASTGTYYDTLKTAGCDSVVTLNLTIHNSTTGDTTATACDSFDWYGNACKQLEIIQKLSKQYMAAIV